MEAHIERRSSSIAKIRQFCFCISPVHNKVISGFQALRQARAPKAGLEPATEGSLQISGRICYPLCHRRPKIRQKVECISCNDDDEDVDDADEGGGGASRDGGGRGDLGGGGYCC
ncbi:hypothetical protein PoB_000875800 [Plakobranchus ocellatus]|uniref:Uncharacterized protein n=1 Tax=Plakobranchus ocellatus TaxID=259542 RepID=A0AAV3YJ60_9GAST|nr:hypothetical protein PoB_000875800 [Plakobranchus ocellatus]